FYWFDGREEERGRTTQLALGVQASPGLHRRILFIVRDTLCVGQIRVEVANVFVARVAHRTDAIKGFIHAVARGVDVLTIFRAFVAQENLPLHARRHFNASERQHSGREINEGHQIVAHCTGFELGWPANQERDFDATVVDPAFVARHPTSVIAKDADYRV